MSRMKLAHALVLAGILVMFARHAAADPGTSTVPFVGCPGDGQVGPVAPPLGDPVPVRIDSAIARQLAFYKGDTDPGVFAPKGWHCRLWYGSDGSFIIVTPSPPAHVFPARLVSGLGVEIGLSYGGTSGRFEVAKVSARFFPNIMHDFIQDVREAGLLKDSDFVARPYSHDVVKKINDRMVEFETPANRNGFGTRTFTKSNQSVRGIVALGLPSNEVNLATIRVRLSAEQAPLVAAIIKIEESSLVGTALN